VLKLKNGFYNSHKFRLAILMFEEHFGWREFPVKRIVRFEKAQKRNTKTEAKRKAG
jgi:hypothetical protein